MSLSASVKCALAAAGVVVGMSGWVTAAHWGQPVVESKEAAAPAKPAAPDPLAVALSAHEGSDPLDELIRRTQERVTKGGGRAVALGQLGRLFVAKARLSADPGFYKLAEQCALAMEAAEPGSLDALLLRGHTLGAMHHFKEAEAIGRQLVAAREQMLDFALLGDALMEQGRLDEAMMPYQRMIDLKPCLQSYTRVAHFRWLKGDVEGAAEVMEQAVESGSMRDPEPVAWASTRLAAYRLQSGDAAATEQLSTRATTLVPDYPPALLLRGRRLLSEGQAAEALAPLQRACEQNTLPEYQWALAEGLRAAGNEAEAATVEKQMQARGAVEDPRTLSLYLATEGRRPEEALRLAEQELEKRQDIFTYDALAWAQWACGKPEAARENSALALREGTQDARLLLHAGIIAGAADRAEGARRLEQAQGLRQMLLPSERQLLDRQLAPVAMNQDSNSHLQTETK